MPVYHESIVIARPVSDVFAYMNDVAREREWQPNIQTAEQIPAGLPGVGTKRRYVTTFLKKRFENEYLNTVYEPDRKVAYVTTPTSNLQARGEVTWERAPEGTRVTITVESEVPKTLRLVPKKAVEATSKRELRRSLERLKEILEVG